MKVDALKPGTQGHNVVVKVVSSEDVLKKGQSKIPSLRKTRVSECLVGDETASILFTARNDQDLLNSSGGNSEIERKGHACFLLQIYSTMRINASSRILVHRRICVDKRESTRIDMDGLHNSRKCEMAVLIRFDISVSDHYHPSSTNRTV